MNYYEKYQPGLSVDCVIFGFHEGELKVLLLKMKNLSRWSVPGGFVRKEEDVDHSATRVLNERTGLSDIYLRQFYLFGDTDRNSKEHVDQLISNQVVSSENENWFRQRFITVGYYALVEFSEVRPAVDAISDQCEWISLTEVPELILDHQKIINKALESLRTQLRIQPIGKSLLPEQFTMTELRTLYETILGEKLDRRNFQRKMLSYGVIDKLNKTRKGGAHKAPYLYSFNSRKYEESVESGFSTIW